MKTLEHGMLLDSKKVMDNAMATLEQAKELIPEILWSRFDGIVALFESELCDCDVRDEYLEKHP